MRVEEEEIANRLRNLLIEWLEYHRIDCNKQNCLEPANMMAFLAHSVGIRSSDLRLFRDQLQEYEVNCKDCGHIRR